MHKSEILAIRGNEFEGSIPDPFANFQDLEFADFGSNMFTGQLPQNVFELPSVRILYFFDNLLSLSSLYWS